APPATSVFPLSLHDALPISWSTRFHSRSVDAGHEGRDSNDLHAATHDAFSRRRLSVQARARGSGPSPQNAAADYGRTRARWSRQDRKSTRLNSSHDQTSYVV